MSVCCVRVNLWGSWAFAAVNTEADRCRSTNHGQAATGKPLVLYIFFIFFFMSYLFTLLLSKSRCSATTLDFSRSRLCSSWRMRACSILVWVYGQKKETKTGKRDPGRKGQGEENTETQTMRIRGGIGKVRTAVVTWSKCGFVEQKKSSDHMIERVKDRGWSGRNVIFFLLVLILSNSWSVIPPDRL